MYLKVFDIIIFLPIQNTLKIKVTHYINFNNPIHIKFLTKSPMSDLRTRHSQRSKKFAPLIKTVERQDTRA